MGTLREAAEQELKLRGYSPRTRKAYLHHMECFVRHFMKDPRQLDEAHIRGYLLHLIELLDHASSKTTEIYTHVSQRDLSRIRSPLDMLSLTHEEEEER